MNCESKLLINYADISILDTEKRANPLLNIRDFFTAYLVETKLKDIDENTFKFPNISLVWRRYSEFEQFQQYLQIEYPFIIVPPLPEKKHIYTWRNPNIIYHDITDPDFVDRRRAGLENFLHRVAFHPILCKNKVFKHFLTKEISWNDSLKQEGYIHSIESKLKDLTIIPKSDSSNVQFKNVLEYSKQLENNLESILKTRLKLADDIYTIDSIHLHLGRLFSEWSVIEKCVMGDALQKAGHFIDTVASCTETSLQDEDVIVDQLKEYLFYSNSIEIVFKHLMKSQLHLESLKTCIKTKIDEKQKVERGKSTFMIRLFGTLQTTEIKNEKIQQFSECIQEDQSKIAETEESLKHFSENALEDFKRFQKQKDVDIQETLSSYIFHQIKLARRSLNSWMNIKSCIEAIP